METRTVYFAAAWGEILWIYPCAQKGHKLAGTARYTWQSIWHKILCSYSNNHRSSMTLLDPDTSIHSLQCDMFELGFKICLSPFAHRYTVPAPAVRHGTKPCELLWSGKVSRKLASKNPCGAATIQTETRSWWAVTLTTSAHAAQTSLASTNSDSRCSTLPRADSKAHMKDLCTTI